MGYKLYDKIYHIIYYFIKNLYNLIIKFAVEYLLFNKF